MNTPRLFLISCLLVLTGGCTVTNLKSDVDPNLDLGSLKTIYVARQPKDRRGIEKMIAEELSKYGKETSYGDSQVPPEQVDAVVTYVDKWMWDLTNYLIDLTINFQAPDTGYKMATGNSYRTSLARKSPEGMVEEVIGKIFENEPSGDN